MLKGLSWSCALVALTIVLGTTIFPDTPPFISSWNWLKDNPILFGDIYVIILCKLMEGTILYSLLTNAIFCGGVYLTIVVMGAFCYIEQLKRYTVSPMYNCVYSGILLI